MKKIALYILCALGACVFTACSNGQPAPSATVYEFKQSAASGLAWTNPQTPAVPDSVLTLDAAAAPVFVPRSDFASAIDLDGKVDKSGFPNGQYLSSFTAVQSGSYALGNGVAGGVMVPFLGFNALGGSGFSQFIRFIGTDGVSVSKGDGVYDIVFRGSAGFPVTGSNAVIENPSSGLLRLYADSGGGGHGGEITLGVSGGGSSVSGSLALHGGAATLAGADVIIKSGNPVKIQSALPPVPNAPPAWQRVQAAGATEPDDLVTLRQLNAVSTQVGDLAVTVANTLSGWELVDILGNGGMIPSKGKIAVIRTDWMTGTISDSGGEFPRELLVLNMSNEYLPLSWDIGGATPAGLNPGEWLHVVIYSGQAYRIGGVQ